MSTAKLLMTRQGTSKSVYLNLEVQHLYTLVGKEVNYKVIAAIVRLAGELSSCPAFYNYLAWALFLAVHVNPMNSLVIWLQKQSAAV